MFKDQQRCKTQIYIQFVNQTVFHSEYFGAILLKWQNQRLPLQIQDTSCGFKIFTKWIQDIKVNKQKNKQNKF